MYSPNLVFDQPRTFLRFDAAALRLPVRYDERSLKSFLAGAPLNVILKYSDRQSLYAKIRHALRGRGPERWPLFADLATELHLTESTLRRRLMADGISYQLIKDDRRHRRRARLRRTPDLSSGVQEMDRRAARGIPALARRLIGDAARSGAQYPAVKPMVNML